MIKEQKENERCPDQDKIIEDGFSSEEELQEQIILEAIKEQQPERNHKEQVHFKIPPPQQIKDKVYSLRPDLETGWNTKLDLPSPIPIMFESQRFDSLVRRALKQPKAKAPIIYLGPRYENTYYAWYDKPFTFPYNHIKAPNDMKFTNRPFCGQHWQAEQQLVFDSFFESGNLDCVFKVGERQYDCFMRVDSNTAGHLQWFNFKVKGWKKLLKYKINICNFQKDKCLFTRGMKPYIFSEKKNKKEKIGWQQDGQNVRFQRKALTAGRVYQSQMRQMWRLSFEYYTQYEEDEIQIAYCVPYTYTRLGQFLQGLTSRPQTKQFLKVSKLCNSLGGLQVPLLIVHHGLEEGPQQQEGVPTRCVVISGRAHPGQSNGSHMIEGFIDWICGDSKEANILRRFLVFKIVPMLNPDGVALGNYRTGLSGRDSNRQYKMPDKTVFPEVYNFKKLCAQNKELFGQRLLMFLDFHGHSTKKNTFVYGPQFPIVDRFYYQSRIFPKLLGNVTPMFRYYSCIFKINQVKNSTARAILLRRLGIPMSYTIQTSNGAYFDYEQLKDVPFKGQLWVQMGAKVGIALYQYFDLLLTADRNRFEKKEARKKNKQGREMSIKRQGQKHSGKGKVTKVQKTAIFSAMQNEKIKHLFDEIKKAQVNRQSDVKSDDGMQQGSSDGQGQHDDLSPSQTNYLLQMIKGGKFRSLSRCKLRTKSKPSTRKTSEDLTHRQVVEEQRIEEITLSKQEESQSQEVFRGRKAINIRKPHGSREKILSMDDKKSTPKIINFSFCSQGDSRRGKDAFKTFLAPRLNFVQLVAGKWSQERQTRKQSNPKQRVVVDLSDPHFHKTFTHNMHRQKNQQSISNSSYAGPSRSINSYIPTKRGRFEHYKYRRLLLNNQGETSQ